MILTRRNVAYHRLFLTRIGFYDASFNDALESVRRLVKRKAMTEGEEDGLEEWTQVMDDMGEQRPRCFNGYGLRMSRLYPLVTEKNLPLFTQLADLLVKKYDKPSHWQKVDESGVDVYEIWLYAKDVRPEQWRKVYKLVHRDLRNVLDAMKELFVQEPKKSF